MSATISLPTWHYTQRNCTWGATTATTSITSTVYYQGTPLAIGVTALVTETYPPTCEWSLQCSTLQPNPDIAGLGVGYFEGKLGNLCSQLQVTVSFLVSAYALLVLLLWSYWYGMLPRTLVRRVDSSIFSANSRNVQSRWRIIIEETILVICDQQLITGLGILIAGFIQAFLYDLSAYHWNAVVYLAWISSTVHLMTISILRDKLNANKVSRNIRLCVMLCILGMLVGALAPTTGMMWNMSFAIQSPWSGYTFSGGKESLIAAPVRCFWNSGLQFWFDPERSADISPNEHPSLLTSILLVLTYGWKFCQLFDRCRNGISLWGRARIETALENVARRNVQHSSLKTASRISSWIRFKLATRVYILYVLGAELLESFMAMILTVATILSWGTVKLVGPFTDININIQKWEHEMGFGQILPILLLLQPLFALFRLSLGKEERINPANSMETADNQSDTFNNPSVSTQPPYAMNTLSYFPTPATTLTAALSNTNVQLLSPQEKAGEQHHDPIIEHLYLSRAFKAMIYLANTLYVLGLISFLYLVGARSIDLASLWLFGTCGFACFLGLCFLMASCSKKLS